MEHMKPIRFSDSPLRWVSALPMYPGGTHYQGELFEFLPNRKKIEEALTRQITEGAYLPPILKEHTPDGTAYGNAVAWRMLELDEAEALGIPQKAPLELYLGLDIRSADLANKYDSGELVFTSPDIRGTLVSGEPYQDETGEPWDFFIGEISAVGVPHNKRQTAAHHLRGVQMKDKRKVRMSDGTVIEIEPEAPVPEGGTVMADDGMTPELTIADLADMMKTCMAELQAIKAAQGASPMADPASTPAPETPPAAAPAAAPAATAPVNPLATAPVATMSDKDIDRRIAAALARREAEREVDEWLSANTVGITREKLVSLAMSDRETYKVVTMSGTPKPGATQRQSVGGAKGLSPLEQLTSREYAVQMREKHTKNGVFDAKAYADEYKRIRAPYTLSSRQGAA